MADVRDRAKIAAISARERVDAVVHFAAFKAVGESSTRPIEYFANNVGGPLCLCEVMAQSACKVLVFSSSATVYGKPERLPISEDAPLAHERRQSGAAYRRPTRRGRSRSCAASTLSEPTKAA
jgi:UDP-glucose 4-epimerase